MFFLVLTVHVIVSVFLIMVVLLQTGKGGDIASAFGGSGTQTAFGPRGASNVLTKATTACAVLFMLTSLALVFLSQSQRETMLSDENAAPAPIEQPADQPDTPAGSDESADPDGDQ